MGPTAFSVGGGAMMLCRVACEALSRRRAKRTARAEKGEKGEWCAVSSSKRVCSSVEGVADTRRRCSSCWRETKPRRGAFAALLPSRPNSSSHGIPARSQQAGVFLWRWQLGLSTPSDFPRSCCNSLAIRRSIVTPPPQPRALSCSPAPLALVQIQQGFLDALKFQGVGEKLVMDRVSRQRCDERLGFSSQPGSLCRADMALTRCAGGSSQCGQEHTATGCHSHLGARRETAPSRHAQ